MRKDIENIEEYLIINWFWNKNIRIYYESWNIFDCWVDIDYLNKKYQPKECLFISWDCWCGSYISIYVKDLIWIDELEKILNC